MGIFKDIATSPLGDVTLGAFEALDNIAEDEEIYGLVSDAAEQAANQARRYIAGAEKQLEGLQNMLERAKRQKSFDA